MKTSDFSAPGKPFKAATPPREKPVKYQAHLLHCSTHLYSIYGYWHPDLARSTLRVSCIVEASYNQRVIWDGGGPTLAHT